MAQMKKQIESKTDSFIMILDLIRIFYENPPPVSKAEWLEMKNDFFCMDSAQSAKCLDRASLSDEVCKFWMNKAYAKFTELISGQINLIKAEFDNF